jgi:hypothetical protein
MLDNDRSYSEGQYESALNRLASAVLENISEASSAKLMIFKRKLAA